MAINDYGLIGDCRSAALVGKDGSIDWLCLPRFDSPSMFARLLDSQKGGHWQIAPVGRYDVTQRYRDRTNVLRTTFHTAGGVLNVIDFMPVDAKTVKQPAALHSRPRVVRIVECVAGEVEVASTLDVAPAYAQQHLRMKADANILHGDGENPSLHVCVQGTIKQRSGATTFKLSVGEAAAFGLRTDDAGRCGKHLWSVERARQMMRTTRDYWWNWIGDLRYEGPYQEPVWRSALALKLMTYAPSGAIVAAPTTSLPELVGSYHNYDYRFTWLRDAAFTLYALFQLELRDEATDFFGWLTRLGLGYTKTSILNLYTVDGGSDVGESDLKHLDGYRHSRPVRIGNAAVDQVQLDVYGEIMDSAYLFVRFGGKITRSFWRELRRIVDTACERWQEPDSSIWEGRGDPEQFTYSKVMCWVAVDRGLRIAERFNLPHASEKWKAARRAIHREVTSQGWSSKHKAFTQTLGGDKLDAALLRMTQVRFLPDRDPRIKSTVRAIRKELADGPLVRRFRRAADDYGTRRREGAFLLCSFWLVDALAHLGEVEEAELLFSQLLAFSSPLGLYAEECDPVNGQALGNYPQAFTHLALIGAAVNIERARHKTLAPRGLKKPP